jgi:hypothetical protein
VRGSRPRQALWITLAQSWLQLGEHVERFAKTRHIAIDADEALATQSVD